MAMAEQQKSVEEKETALVNLKRDLQEKETALAERDAALKDALAREEKVKQDYPEVRKLITSLQMAMTAEEQKPVLEKKAALLNINDPVDEIKKLLKTFVQLLKRD
jgi:septal ring factor EnvC (AmiA/AmiB activator)